MNNELLVEIVSKIELGISDYRLKYFEQIFKSPYFAIVSKVLWFAIYAFLYKRLAIETLMIADFLIKLKFIERILCQSS